MEKLIQHVSTTRKEGVLMFLSWRLGIILTFFLVYFSFLFSLLVHFYLTTEAVSTGASHHEGVNVTVSICIVSPASQTYCVTQSPVIVLHQPLTRLRNYLEKSNRNIVRNIIILKRTIPATRVFHMLNPPRRTSEI